MQFSTLHWIVLCGYIVGALLLIKGGNGLLLELTERKRKVVESSKQMLSAGRQDLDSLSQALTINAEAKQAFSRLLQAQVDGGPDALSKVTKEGQNIEVLTEEMRLQNLRGDSATVSIAPAKEELNEALHGAPPGSLAGDAKALWDLERKLRSVQKDKWITFGGVLVTTFASCVSLFIP